MPETRVSNSPVHEYDKPRTFAQTAAALGVPYHVVQRAARRGFVPTYRMGSSRRYVRIRDFLELMTKGERLLSDSLDRQTGGDSL